MRERFRRLAGDRELRLELVRAGRARVREFSWEKAVRETWTVYRKSVRRSLAVFFVDRDLQGAQEAMVLRGEFDLAGGFERPLLGLLCRLDLLLVLFVVFVPSIEADGGFQNEEDVVAGSS